MAANHWFGPKTIGWGASPSSWEGWLLVAVYVGIMILIARYPGASGLLKLLLMSCATVGVVGLVLLQYQSR